MATGHPEIARASEESPNSGRRSARRSFAELWTRIEPYFGGNGRRMALFVVTSALNGFGEAAVLYAIVRIATAIAAGDEAVDVAVGPLAMDGIEVWHLFAIAGVLVVVLLGLSTASAALAARMSVVALTNARQRTFDAFSSASWDIQSREREGHLQELLTAHTRKIAQGVMIITDGITATVSFLAFFVSALVISPAAAIVILVGVVGLYLALRPATRLTKHRSRQHAESNVRYAESVTQAVRLAKEIRAFGVSDAVRDAVTADGATVARHGFATRLLGKLTPKLYQNAALLLVLAGLIGVYASGASNATELGAVVLLLVRALSYSQLLQDSVQQASETAPYLSGLREQEQRYVAHVASSGPLTLGTVEDLRLEGVSFEYEPGRPVLTEVSFAVHRGETIGIVGPSGSGKSTLVQLLLGLRLPTAGRYCVNGRPTQDYSGDSWFAQYALVPQDNQLLRASVADNIRFWRSHIDHPEIERAARRAHLHDEIALLRSGYATPLGADSTDLSGGQRQRLGLARALAGEPSVIVLDEPTSALDLRSESLVRQTLDELNGRITVFIVAHRMTTLSRCDRIMVIDHGRIDAFDTPSALVRSNRFFREANELSQLI